MKRRVARLIRIYSKDFGKASPVAARAMEKQVKRIYKAADPKGKREIVAMLERRARRTDAAKDG